MMFSSLRGSAMTAALPWRGTSSNRPPLSIRSLARSRGSYSCGEPNGPLPYTESRSSDGVRALTVCSGAVVIPSGDVVSNVMSWSKN